MNMNRRELLMSAAAGMTLVKGAHAAARAGESGAAAGQTAAANAADDQIFELRQYTLHRGQRDVLISLFEKYFIEPHDAVGSHVYGLFRDVDDPDRFVWIRGFGDMSVRQSALTAFYGGPVWQEHRNAANPTMLDSDNVLMLKPAMAGSGFSKDPLSAAHAPAAPSSRSVMGATLYYLHGVDSALFTRFFDEAILPQLAAAGVRPLARLVTEESPNNFPKLPIREHDRVFVWFARWPDLAAEQAFVTKFSALSGWRDSAPEAVLPALAQKPERLRLMPASRSPLR